MDYTIQAGLCAECAHALVRPTNKGTIYLRCGLAATDDRFPRYPRLPVLDCPGFEPYHPAAVTVDTTTAPPAATNG